MSAARRTPAGIEVRDSALHGLGVFATKRIKKGARVVEYLGERVSHAEADRRYDDKDENDNHTFLFIVDGRTVIDAGVDGNEARFINHGCDPNCQSVSLKKRVFIEAIRTIPPGHELSYDYQIQRDPEDAPDVDVIFACRCGAPSCRGSMLEPRKKPRTVKRRRAGGARRKLRKRTRPPLRKKSARRGR
jgi:SET domain-containing protein